MSKQIQTEEYEELTMDEVVKELRGVIAFLSVQPQYISVSDLKKDLENKLSHMEKIQKIVS